MSSLIHFSSTRFSLAIIIFLMGLLGFLFAILSGEWYKSLVLENELKAYNKLLQYEVDEDLAEHEELVTTMTRAMLKNKTLKSAFTHLQRDKLENILNNQFNQYFVTAKRIYLFQLAILDLNYLEIAKSTQGKPDNVSIDNCWEVLKRAKARKGTRRLKVFTDLCSHQDYPLHIYIVPIGGLIPKGFLAVLTDPVKSLREISRGLNSPIEFRLINGNVIQRSGDWPTEIDQEHWAKTRFVKHNTDNKPILIVELYKNTDELHKTLKDTRLKILLIVFVTTVVVVLIVFFFVNSRLLRPLQALNNQLQRIQKNRMHLKQALILQGNKEMRQLTGSFNEMSTELAGLYSKLELMAFSDPLTNLPNRAWFYKDLKRLSKLSNRSLEGFSLMFLDLNKFKFINDEYGHQVGDAVLKITAERISNVVRESDYMARIKQGNENSYEDSLSRMGGDEFAIILPNVVKLENVITVVEKIIQVVVEPIQYENLELQLGVSIGIAFYPQDSRDIDSLIHYADLAMYDAKANGTGYSRFSESLLQK